MAIKVKMNATTKFGGVLYEKGKEYSVPEDTAKRWESNKLAKKTTAAKPAK